MFDTYHTLIFNSVTQYLVTIVFTDFAALTTIVPSELQIEVQGVGVRNLQDTTLWLDAGSSFRIVGVLWQDVDVKPSQSAIYKVEMPSTLTVNTRIFDAEIRVLDALGIPISGASVSVVFANGTTILSQTGSDGKLVLRMIPLGTFKATVSNLGVAQQAAVDASLQNRLEVRLPMSYPILTLIIVLVGGALGTVFLFVRRRAS